MNESCPPRRGCSLGRVFVWENLLSAGDIYGQRHLPFTKKLKEGKIENDFDRQYGIL